MDFVFNDMPFEYKVDSIYDACDILNRFVSIIVELESNNKKVELVCNQWINNLELIDGDNLLKTFNSPFLKQDKKRILLSHFCHKKIVDCHDTFSYEKTESKICAHANKNNIPVISLLTDDKFDLPYLEGKIQGKKAVVINISQSVHVVVHSGHLKIRIYEMNPKHKIGYGWGSPMDLDDETAQKLLDKAIPYDSDERCLVNKYNGKYYVFRNHINNCYHGYCDKKIPESVKRKFL